MKKVGDRGKARLHAVYVAVAALAILAACGSEPAARKTPPEPSPSETASPSFVAEGLVLEVHPGSRAADTPQPSPAPQQQPAPPSPSPTGKVFDVPRPVPTRRAAGGDAPAPGAVLIELAAFTGKRTRCRFNPGDRLVVAFTSKTRFHRTDTADLVNRAVIVRGRLLDGAGCLPVADSITATGADGTVLKGGPPGVGRTGQGPAEVPPVKVFVSASPLPPGGARPRSTFRPSLPDPPANR